MKKTTFVILLLTLGLITVGCERTTRRTKHVSSPTFKSGSSFTDAALLEDGPDKNWEKVSVKDADGNVVFEETIAPENGENFGKNPEERLRIGEVARIPTIYRFGKDDVLKVVVDEQDIFSGVFTVDGDGKIKLPEHDKRIMAEGATLDQLKKRIKSEISRYFKKDTIPKILITLKENNSRRYYVMGEEMPRQGSFPMDKNKITVLEAIIKAGTSAESVDETFDVDRHRAALTRVRIITPHPVKPTVRVVNVYKMYHKGFQKGNIYIKPNDIVYVPDTAKVWTEKKLDWIFKWARMLKSFDQEGVGDYDYLRERLGKTPRGRGF